MILPRIARRLIAVPAIVAAVLIVLLSSAGAVYRPNVELPAGFGGRHFYVHGVPLRVLQRGTGPDVLLLHGSPGSIEDWLPVIDALADSFRVTAFDRPGHGYSGDGNQYSLQYNAYMALGLIDVLKLEHVVMVGHSYGGASALAAALRMPPNVDAYVIVDSASYEPSRTPTALYKLLAVPTLGIGVAMILGPLLAPKRIRHGLIAQFARRTPPEDFIAVRTRIWSTPKVTHAVALETLGAAAELAAQSPGYPSITRPVHILAQAGDAFRRTTAERLQRAIANSSLRLVSGTGHYLQLEATADVAAVIRRAAAK